MTDFRSQLQTLSVPIIIGIAGDSASGKTTYSNGIRRLLGRDIVQTITMDGYHKENREQRAKSGILPLDPSANHLDRLKEHLSLLKAGKSVEIPVYNHMKGDFDKPVLFSPSPIIILEGLHALYPDFLPFLDFSIYVDPSREVKWGWKQARDLRYRGHTEDHLSDEMYKREVAYKRWIDFQKTDAIIVIKVFPTTLKRLARYESLYEISTNSYKVELIMKPAISPLPTITLPFDLSNVLDITHPPFLLAAVPSYYWGKKTTVIHIDGVLSQQTVLALENHIMSLTKTPLVSELITSFESALISSPDQLSAVQFAQLLIVWRFLEMVGKKLEK